MSHDRRRSTPARSALRTIALVAALGACTLTPARAQETGAIGVIVRGPESGSFMISCIHDGAVVFQTEAMFGAQEFCHVGGSSDIPVGAYDVRVERDGTVTQVKRGVLVTPQNQTTLQFAMESGEGVRTIEYSTGALAREEVAARLQALEAARTSSEDRIAALEQQVADLIRGSNRQ